MSVHTLRSSNPQSTHESDVNLSSAAICKYLHSQFYLMTNISSKNTCDICKKEKKVKNLKMAASLKAQAAAMPQCIICLDSLLEGDVSCLTPCGHVFHSKCIKEGRKNWILEEKNLFESGTDVLFVLNSDLCPQCKE